ncbi:recombination-associated protein RdgC [Endothiovibrio diazotrophicus]
MMFKKLTFFTLPQDLPHRFYKLAPHLEEALALQTERDLGEHEMRHHFWVPPMGRTSAQLVHTQGDRHLVCLKSVERELSAGAIKEALEKRVAELERERGAVIHRREKADIRDNLIQSMMPGANPRSKLTYAYFDFINGWLVIDQTAAGRVDALTSTLRSCLHGLPIKPPATNDDPSIVMTDWVLRGRDTHPFQIGTNGVLQGPDGDKVTIKNDDLASEAVRDLLTAGKRFSKLELTWDERISFTVDHRLALTGIHYHDIVHEERGDCDTDADRFDSDMAIMTGEFSELIPALTDMFGGLSA